MTVFKGAICDIQIIGLIGGINTAVNRTSGVEEVCVVLLLVVCRL